MKALITRKVGMTSTINENGVVEAITLLSVGEHTVTAHKTTEKDGYTAVQVGAETAKKLSKSVSGHVKAAKVMPKVIREFRIEELPEDLNVGDKITADVFSIGDTVHATGTSKGKGWAGTIRRTTSTVVAKLTAVVATAALVPSVLCILNTSLRELRWPASWAMIKSPFAT